MIISLSTLSTISTAITTKAAYSSSNNVDVYYRRALLLHPYYYFRQPMALPLLLLHLSAPRHRRYSSISIYDGFSRLFINNIPIVVHLTMIVGRKASSRAVRAA